MEAVARRLIRGERPDEREISFAHGYAVAIHDVFEYPERVDEDLERAAEKAYKRVLEAEITADGEDAPYA